MQKSFSSVHPDEIIRQLKSWCANISSEPWWPNGHLLRWWPEFDPVKVESSESASVNHSLTTPRCKHGINISWEDRFGCISPVGL